MKRVIVLLWACLSSTLLLANHWTPDNPGAYAYVMGVTSVVEINDVEQFSDQFEVGAFCGTECRGSQMATQFSLTGRYLAMITVYGEEGDEITFRLYDHSTAQEVEGVGLTTVTFTQDGYGTTLEPVAIGFYTNLDITVTATPANGGTVTGGGAYLYHSQCTLTATPQTGYTFINWTLDGNVVSTNPSYTFTVTEAAAYVAHFQIQSYAIAANVTPANSGTVQGAGTYDYGQTCTLTATPATGYEFVNWTKGNAVVSDEATYSFTVTGAGTYVAHFRLQTFAIAANVSPANSGTVQGAGTYEYNSTCTLTATPATGYEFVNWTKGNAVVSEAASYSFTVTEAGTYVAHFQIQSYEITATANPDNAGMVEGAGTYEYGSECTLTATPAEGYVFVSWLRNGTYVSNNPSYTFTVTGAANYVARFAEEGYVENHWTAENPGAYPYVMGVTSVIAINGVEQYSDLLEVGAFCGSECRGSQIAQEFYVTGRYLAMITVFGEIGDEITFRLYDHSIQQEVEGVSQTTFTFTQDGYGTTLEPVVLDFYTMMDITVAATPAEGGTVTGGGSYLFGSECTLSAVPAEGYTFINWTQDGNEVSTEPSYTFTVSEAGAYEAHFLLNSYEITVTAHPAEGGTVTGAGTYNHGATCTLEATPAEGYIFISWLQNGAYVTNEATYTFTVTEAADYVARFALEGYIEPYWTPESAQFPFYMALTAVVKIDGEEQSSDWLEVGAFCGEQCRGSQITEMFYLTGSYLAMINVYGEEGDVFTFRLYDHSIAQEVEAVCITPVAFQTDLGTTLEPFVLEFSTAEPVAQTTQFTAGWNWWSTCIEQNGIDGLEMLENGLGASGLRIQGRNGSVDYFEYQGTGYWYGALDAINSEQMFKVRTSEAIDVELVGMPAYPENHPITIVSGWNWIGYPVTQPVSVNVALSDLIPENDDVIKGRNGSASYVAYNGYHQWYGTLTTLEPGQGYMYKSNSAYPQPLVYQLGRTNGEWEPNVTSESNINVPAAGNYADNMLITAVVEQGGEELRSGDYELAAFAGDECRGSVKLMYVEPFDRYVAFLLVYGDAAETLHFVLTDGTETSLSDDFVTYQSDLNLGTLSEPFTLNFRPMGLEDNTQIPVSVYPNPAKDVINVECLGLQRVEVMNAYGQVIYASEVENDYLQINLGEQAAGAYLLRVVTANGITTKRVLMF